MKDKNSGRPARDGESSSLDQNIRKLPIVDWNLQSIAPSFRGGAGSFGEKNRTTFRAFRALSQGFLDAEAKREDRIEGAVFCVIVALSAWPIVQAAQALFGLIK